MFRDVFFIGIAVKLREMSGNTAGSQKAQKGPSVM
jgi:hypothetical protein